MHVKYCRAAVVGGATLLRRQHLPRMKATMALLAGRLRPVYAAVLLLLLVLPASQVYGSAASGQDPLNVAEEAPVDAVGAPHAGGTRRP